MVRDSGSRRLDAGWLGADQRWTFSHMSTSIQAAVAGLGFAWYPEMKIATELQSGHLQPLPLTTSAERFGTLCLVHADGELAPAFGGGHVASLPYPAWSPPGVRPAFAWLPVGLTTRLAGP